MPENAERHRAVSRIASQTPSPSAVSLSLSLCVLLVLGGKSASFALRTKRYSRLQPQQPPCCSCSCCCCCPSPSRAAQHKLRISIFMFPCDAVRGAFAVAAYDLCAAMTHRTVLVQLQSLPGPTPPTPAASSGCACCSKNYTQIARNTRGSHKVRMEVTAKMPLMHAR